MRQPRSTSRHSAAASAPPGKTPVFLPGGGAPPSKKRKHDEDDLQRDVCSFLDLAVKRPDRYWAVPNGGKRGEARTGADGKRKAPIEAARMKALGVKAGVSDLHFAWAFGASRQFPAFGVIELKAGTNTETDEQERFGKDMIALGHTYAVCRSVEEVERTLREWGFPLQATVLPSGVTFRTVAR